MKKFVNSNKMNKILNEIFEEFKECMALEDIKRYKKEFRMLPDYNIAQYGNLLVYYYDIRKLFESCDYKNVEKTNTKGNYVISDETLWNRYKSLVGIVADYIVANEKEVAGEFENI